MGEIERILFIDDDANQRDLTVRLYQMCAKVFHGSVEFLTAPSWETGLAIIRGHRVDVVICDLTLPPMRSEETMLKVRQTPDLPPVIALTGNEADPKLRRKCFENGFDGFSLKSEVNHHPESLCEKCYDSFLRREYRTQL